MPPKKNKQREKQEQGKATSSSKAQEMLRSSAAAGVGGFQDTIPSGFIGFSAFATTTTSTTPSSSSKYEAKATKGKKIDGFSHSVAISFYDGNDHDINMALKMLGKKDAVTKTKALTNLLNEVLPPRKPLEIRPMIGHFGYLYANEMKNSNDRRVRQLSNEVLVLLCEKMKPKAFMPHFKRLLPFWLLAMHDLNTEVSSAAKKAMNNLIPERNERLALLEENLENILTNYQEFFNSKVDTFSDLSSKPDEQEERYERCLSAAVLAMEYLIVEFAHEPESFTKRLTSSNDNISMVSLISSTSFTQIIALTSKNANFQREIIRKAMYKLMLRICIDAKDQILKTREEFFAKQLFFYGLNEKNPINHEDMWNALLTFLKICSHTAQWQSQSFVKMVENLFLPRLLSQIRHGFYGSYRVSFPSLLPLLSLIPLRVQWEFYQRSAANSKKGSRSFIATELLQAAWKFNKTNTREQANINELTQVLMESFFECASACFTVFLSKNQGNQDFLEEMEDKQAFREEYVKIFGHVFEEVVEDMLQHPIKDVAVITYKQFLLFLSRVHAGAVDSANTTAGMIQKAFLSKIFDDLLVHQMVNVFDSCKSHLLKNMVLLLNSAASHDSTSLASLWLPIRNQVLLDVLDKLPEMVGNSQWETVNELLQLVNCLFETSKQAGLNEFIKENELVEYYNKHFAGLLTQTSEEKILQIECKVFQHFLWSSKSKASAEKLLEGLFTVFGLKNVEKLTLEAVSRATLIVEHGLAQIFTLDKIVGEANTLWLSSGASSNTQTDPALLALQSVWSTQVLDQLVLKALTLPVTNRNEREVVKKLVSVCLGDGVRMKATFALVSVKTIEALYDLFEKGAFIKNAVQMVYLPLQTFYSSLKVDGKDREKLRVRFAKALSQLVHVSCGLSSFEQVTEALQDQAQNMWNQKVLGMLLNSSQENLRLELSASLQQELKKAFTSQCYVSTKWAFLLLRLLSLEDDKAQSNIVSKLGFFLDVSALVEPKDNRYFLECFQTVWSNSSQIQQEAIRGFYLQHIKLNTLVKELFIMDFSNLILRAKQSNELIAAEAFDWGFEHKNPTHLTSKLVQFIKEHLLLKGFFISFKGEKNPIQAGFLDFIDSTNVEGTLASVGDVKSLQLSEVTVDFLAVLFAGVVACCLEPHVKKHEILLKLAEISKSSRFALNTLSTLVSTGFFSDETSCSTTKDLLLSLMTQSPANDLSGRLAVILARNVDRNTGLDVQILTLVQSEENLEHTVDIVEYLVTFTDGCDQKEQFISTIRTLFVRILSSKNGPKVYERQTIDSVSTSTLLRRRLLAQLWLLLEKLDALEELALHHREAFWSVVNCSIAEMIDYKTQKGQQTEMSALGWKKIVLSMNMSTNFALILRCFSSSYHSIPSGDASLMERIGLAYGKDPTKWLIKYLDEPFVAPGADDVTKTFSWKSQLAVYVLLRTCCLSSLSQQVVEEKEGDEEDVIEDKLIEQFIPASLRQALEKRFSSAFSFGLSGHTEAAGDIDEAAEGSFLYERDFVNAFLVWDLFLRLFPSTSSGSSTIVSSALGFYVGKRTSILKNFLNACVVFLQEQQQQDKRSFIRSIESKASSDDWEGLFLPTVEDFGEKHLDLYQLGACVYFRTVVRLPALVRSWWNEECSRSARSWAGKYFEDNITPLVLTSELNIISKASTMSIWDADEMSVKGSKVSREITTTYVKDECALEMVIKVPASYPLRSVEVECTKRIGISEDRWRRWVLQIIKLTSNQDGSLLDAVLLWKNNVDKEFEGVEPCPICYSILNPKTMGLPNLPCKTCSNKYHNSCLYKWFNQSGKNKCPICQQPFC